MEIADFANIIANITGDALIFLGSTIVWLGKKLIRDRKESRERELLQNYPVLQRHDEILELDALHERKEGNPNDEALNKYWANLANFSEEAV